MSRDYKPSPEKPKNVKKGNPLFTGLLIGILLGIAASLGVVMFIKGGTSPFTNQTAPDKAISERMLENANADNQTGKDNSALPTAESPKSEADKTANQDDKTRFDFYTILPDSESKVSADEEKKLKDNEQQPVVQKSYFLQIGAFQTAEEADNMKAKLALLGFEAVVQTATIGDKGVWHRVRVGPLKNLDQINKTKTDLLNNGFKADLIKVDSENQ